MTEEARKKLDHIIASTFDRGFEAGYRAATWDYIKKLRNEADRLERILDRELRKENDNTRKD